MSGPLLPKVRIKVYSKRGVHRVTVVGDDGFEAELQGVSKVGIALHVNDLARLTAEFIEFEDAIKDLRPEKA